MPHFIRMRIKELLSQYPAGILGSMFAIAFKRRFGEELNYERLRFKSLGHLLGSIPDIAKMDNFQGGGYRIYGRENEVINSGMSLNDKELTGVQYKVFFFLQMLSSILCQLGNKTSIK